MNVISEEYLEADNGLSTYVIVIQNFRKKLREANVGDVASTKEFMVDESKFTIDLYIAGDEYNNRGHLSLFLTNESDWKVRAVTEVSVIATNKKVLSVKRFLLFSDGPDGEIFQSKAADKPERSLGWSKWTLLWRKQKLRVRLNRLNIFLPCLIFCNLGGPGFLQWILQIFNSG